MITLTEAAKTEIANAYSSENFQGMVYLRAGVSGGGCSGFKNVLFFDDKQPSELDFQEVVMENVTLVCDPLSLQYLEGTVIDYVSTLMQSGFQFKNENIKGTCGCGKSVQY